MREFRGDPYETPKTGDTYYASIALRKYENIKGSGVLLHMYPDGTIIASKLTFPDLKGNPATVDKLSKDYKLLYPRYVELF